MTRARLSIVAALALALTAPALAQETTPLPEMPAPASEVSPPSEPPPQEAEVEEPKADEQAAEMPPADPGAGLSGHVELGVFQKDVDTISSKFEEYRDVPNGLVVPFFALRGHRGDLRYAAAGRGVRQGDQQFAIRLDDARWSLDADFNQIPHRFGNDGRTLQVQTGPGAFEISDTVQRHHQTVLEGTNPRSQINFAFLNSLVTPSLSGANRVDLALERERTRLGFAMSPGGGPVGFTVRYLRERRTGDRAAAGTSFGFSNVVEIPEPVHYLTQDFSAAGTVEGSWGSVRAGLNYNSFANRVDSVTFDNPFRITDSTDASAYQAPGSASVNGPAFGRVSLPPDNEALTASAMGVYRLPRATRVSASVQLGSWRQNETPFIPYATNTAITAPVVAADPASLPARQLDGKIGIGAFSAMIASRPVRNLNLSARFRRYDLDNDTPRLSFPGYARFDAGWNPNPRISVPYSFDTNRLDVSAAYDFDRFSVEAFGRRLTMGRTFRETEETDETGFGGAVRFRAADWAVVRASVERASRDYDHYDFEHSEHASFVNDVAATNNPDLIRYDQAKRDYDRLNTQLVLTPGGDFGITLAWSRTDDDYTETNLGLTEAQYQVLSADVDYTPSARWSVYGFYSRERNENLQRGRQSGATPSTNPADDWVSDVTDEVDSLGGGVNVALVPDKWTWNSFARFQKVDGFNDLFSPPGGAPDVAVPIEEYDDTRILTVSSELAYRVSARWSLGLGAWFEDYDIDDAATESRVNYTPGSFFLGAHDANYQALVGWLKLTYRF